VIIREGRKNVLRRIRSEWRRSRFQVLNTFAFRLFYRLRHAESDSRWTRDRALALAARFPHPGAIATIETDDPNSEEVRAFLKSLAPDLVLARCKVLLRPAVFGIPGDGTFILHPGICPDYRNAHGCFWALARRDLENVGATLLRIDEGVDTGPIYAYYRAEIGEMCESHVVIEHRVVFDNLDRIAADLQRVHAGDAAPIDVSGRPSAVWGQPRLSDYLRWKQAARANSR